MDPARPAGNLGGGRGGRLRPLHRPGRGADAQFVRRLGVQAPGPGAQPQARRRAALRRPERAGAFRRTSVRHRVEHGHAGLHVRQPDPPQPARQRPDDHPGPGAQLGDFPRRQDLHLLPAQGRHLPRRCRLDGRGREGDLPAHHPAAARLQQPAHAAVRHRERDQRPRCPHDRVQAQRAAPAELHARRVRQRLEHHRAQADAGGQQLQPAANPRLSRHRPVPVRQPHRQGGVGDGVQPGLLERGSAVSRRHRVLPPAAVFAPVGRGAAGRQPRLRAPARPGKPQDRAGHPGNDRRRLLSERHPGHLGEQRARGVPGSQGAARHSPGAGPRRAGGRGPRRGADAGGRFHLPVLGVRHAAGQIGRTPGLPVRPHRRHPRSARAHGGCRLRRRHPGRGFHDSRGGELQVMVGGHTGHAAGNPEHPDQPAHGAGVGVVRRGAGGEIRLHYQRHRVDADRSLGLLQRLVRQGRPAELLQMVQPAIPGPGVAD